MRVGLQIAGNGAAKMPDTERSSGSAPVPAGATAQQQWYAAGPGLVMVAVAVAALLDLRSIPFGTAIHLGPGAVPGVLAAALLVLGVVIAVERLFGQPAGGGG
jgi:hypothetical protein